MKYRIKSRKIIRRWINESGDITISPKNARLFNSESEAKTEIKLIKKDLEVLDNWVTEFVKNTKKY